MIKKDIVAAMAAHSGLSRRVCGKALSAFVLALGESLESGREVHLAGFGTFRPFRRNPSTRENPITGKPMEIPAKTIPKFTAGESFIELVNGGEKEGS